VLDPGRGRTKTGQLWAYARDDRPWGGTDPPAVAYVYAPDRKASQPIAHLAGFKGVLQVDGYAGYRALAGKGDVTLVFCWAHLRSRFYERFVSEASPIPAEALQRIAALYRIVRGDVDPVHGAVDDADEVGRVTDVGGRHQVVVLPVQLEESHFGLQAGVASSVQLLAIGRLQPLTRERRNPSASGRR
jgi:Transposase IS66 family